MCRPSVQGCDYIDGIMNDVVLRLVVCVFLSKCAFCNTLRLLRKRHHKLLFYCQKARCVYGRVYLHLCSHSFISSLLKIKCKCYWIKEQTAAAGLYGRVNECVRTLIVAQIWCFAGLMLSAVRRCVFICRWKEFVLMSRSVCLKLWLKVRKHCSKSWSDTSQSSPLGPVGQSISNRPKKCDRWLLVHFSFS